jgi:hypothetical protein
VGQDQFHHKDTNGHRVKDPQIAQITQISFFGSWLRFQAKEGAVQGKGVFIAPAI